MIASFLICTNVLDVKLYTAINSCLQQETNFSYEIVIVTNGLEASQIKDEIISKFRNKLRVFSSELIGLSANLNVGLKYCRGEYVLRFDADDICLSNRVETQIRFMLENRDVDISYGNAIIINDDGDRTGYYKSSKQSALGFLVFSNYVSHPTVCYRKEFILSSGGYREKLASEDYDLWIRLLFVHRASFCRINEDLILYRNYSINSFRNKPSAYWSAVIFKLEIALRSRSVWLVLGALFSAFQACFHSTKSLFHR